MSRLANLIFGNIHFPILLGIILLGIWLRTIGWNPDLILDFDPWWFFRHAQEILNNGFTPPEWDLLSFYPPGRPVDFYLGWSYTLAVFYSVASSFMEITFTRFAGIFVAIFAALSAIPAYLVGKHVTNRWGGLATALFAVVTATFISVSIAGYPDSDATNVFYTFLAVIATLFAIKKSDKMDFSGSRQFLNSLARYMPFVIPAVVSYWLFAVNWSSSWYIYYMFVLFIPILVVFRIVESMIRREHSFGLRMFVAKIRENRGLIFAILLIGFIGEAITLATSGWPFNTIPPHDQLVQGLNIIGTQGIALVGFVGMLAIIGAISGVAFSRLRGTVIGGIIGIAIGITLILSGITGQALIVNQSVAELQPIGDIFGGFSTITSRVGTVPVFFALAAFFITALKLIFRKQIHNAEYFAIIWFLISLFLITRGIRFSLLFSMATATAAGFAIGNLIMYSQRRGSTVMLGAVFAIVMVGGVLHFNDVYGFSSSVAGGGLDIGQNFRDGFNWLKENVDKDSLIVTWWDPGHIIAGLTGLKVMADGAHCGPDSCIFLDHNSRIQDMGRAFAISDEDEALKILSRYRSITPEQCQELQQTFPDRFTPESCKPVTDMYVLATSDLIGKYFWLSFFGTGQGDVFNTCNINQGETNRLGAPTYVCTNVPIEISLVQQENRIFAVINAPTQGIRNAPVKDLIFFQNGQQFSITARSNQTNVVDGMVWVDPGFNNLIFMRPNIRDSIFTNMFFFAGNGNAEFGIEPLEKFELVYQNPEMKIFKTKFEDSI